MTWIVQVTFLTVSVVVHFAILAQLVFYKKTVFPKELWLLKLTKYKCKLWYRELSTSSSLEKQGNYLGQSKEKQKRCCGHIALNINCIFSINLFHLNLLFRDCVIGQNSHVPLLLQDQSTKTHLPISAFRYQRTTSTELHFS